jgi:hypothetical protein
MSEPRHTIHHGGYMKKLVENVEGEGLVKLLGERVTLFCCHG